jgi:ABC-type Fe2+-enterobactin transport system substrate-binding protein
MSTLTHHPDRGVVYVSPSLTASLLKIAAALAAASR